jgi:hypothetical protein
MVVGGPYTVAVINVKNLSGVVVDPAHDEATFIIGTAPQVVSATRSGFQNVIIVFDQPMSDGNPGSSGLEDLDNYSFSNPGTAPLVVSLVVKNSSTQVTVTATGEMKTGVDNYTVTVIHVKSVNNDVIDPLFNTGIFSGLGVAPRVSSAAYADLQQCTVTFDESVDPTTAQTAGNYTLTGPSTPNVMAATLVGLVVTLDLDANMIHGDYTVHVDAVTDVAGNVIDPAHDTATYAALAEVQLTSIVITTATTIRVYFDSNLDESSAENTANYSVSIAGHPELSTVVQLATLQANLTDIILQVDVLHCSYTHVVEVSNVKSASDGNLNPDPSSDSDIYVGFGPTISTASINIAPFPQPEYSYWKDIYFNQAMNLAATKLKTNWSLNVVPISVPTEPASWRNIVISEILDISTTLFKFHFSNDRLVRPCQIPWLPPPTFRYELVANDNVKTAGGASLNPCDRSVICEGLYQPPSPYIDDSYRVYPEGVPNLYEPYNMSFGLTFSGAYAMDSVSVSNPGNWVYTGRGTIVSITGNLRWTTLTFHMAGPFGGPGGAHMGVYTLTATGPIVCFYGKGIFPGDKNWAYVKEWDGINEDP